MTAAEENVVNVELEDPRPSLISDKISFDPPLRTSDSIFSCQEERIRAECPIPCYLRENTVLRFTVNPGCVDCLPADFSVLPVGV